MPFQMSGPMLEMCILAVLSHEDSYGYRLTQTAARQLGLSESTLYPVLRRLKKNGFLDVYDRNHDGRNRRYYTITDAGKDYYISLLKDWSEFVKSITSLISPESSGEKSESFKEISQEKTRKDETNE